MVAAPPSGEGAATGRRRRRLIVLAAAVTALALAGVIAATAWVTLREPQRRVLPGEKQFFFLPPGSELPTGDECARRVRPAPEVVPDNATANATTWYVAWEINRWLARADGDFTGTTDEIIQWAACKWGMDEDVLRAQAYQESHWRMDAYGDVSRTGAGEDGETICAPGSGGAVRADGTCAESIGIMQVRTQYFRPTAEGAVASSAYNLDVAMAIWRECYEGDSTWLNNFERAHDYAAGDEWGCLGRWFSGRWHTEAAESYIARVRHWYDERIWEIGDFSR